jgi:hypothetical protein
VEPRPHARIRKPQQQTPDIPASSVSQRVVDATVAEGLECLGLDRPTRDQRNLVADAFRKCALQWSNLKDQGRQNSRYKTAREWFVAEWVPKLRPDLQRMGHSSAYRARMTVPIAEGEPYLEHSIVIQGGKDPKDDRL